MTLIFKLIIFFMTLNYAWASNFLKKFLDPHYNKTKEENDKISYPNRRKTQLYSRNSGRHVQILVGGKVNARGASGDKFAGLVILTTSYGRVRIKGLATDRFLCFDKRGHLISKKRATTRCIFRETFGKDAYTQYESASMNGRFLAFSKKGNPRFKAKNRSGTKAVQFVERPKPRKLTNRYYRGKQGRILPWMLKRDKMLARQSIKYRPRSFSSPEYYGLSPADMLNKEKRLQKNKKTSMKTLERKVKKQKRNGTRKKSTIQQGNKESKRWKKRNSSKNKP